MNDVMIYNLVSLFVSALMHIIGPTQERAGQSYH